jgi:hypothetical protein
MRLTKTNRFSLLENCFPLLANRLPYLPPSWAVPTL